MAATMMEITVMSYILVTPSPIFWNISPRAKAPVPTPTMAASTVPTISTTKTLIPIKAPIRTTRYGTTLINWYSKSLSIFPAFPPARKKKITAVMTAAGRTIRKFSLNLSFISHPWVLTAAMVVSEIMERLSPNMAPHTIAPMQTGREIPVFSAIPTPMGAMAVMVPTEVPMEIEIKQPIINRPMTAMDAGIMDSPRFTVLSTPPAALMVPEKAPAARKIKHMVTIFSSPMPLEIMVILSAKRTRRFCINATIKAMRKPTMAGMV